MGNADDEILAPPDPRQANEGMRRILELSVWGNQQLTKEDLQFLRGFPKRIEITLGNTPVLCVHGSPRSFDEVIRAETESESLNEMLEGEGAPVIAMGHTHIQMLRRHGRHTLINPGSVGLAYDPPSPDPEVRCAARAEFAIIEETDEGFACQFHRLPYDPAPVVAAAMESGMPHGAWWAKLWKEAP